MTNIGIFDSGLGGLTVLSELIKINNANYYYFGDSLRAPYGNKSVDEIIKFSDQIVDYLEKFDIDYYIIACNTISVWATDFLTDKYNKKFYPITKAGLGMSMDCDGDFLVLGTKATVDSHFYKNNIEKLNDAKVYEVAGVKLVDYIEAGITTGDDLDEALKEYLQIANQKRIANIILACTHYPIISQAIRDNLSYEANIINPANFLARDLKDIKSDERLINIFMSKVDENSEKIIDNLLDCEYKLQVKEL